MKIMESREIDLNEWEQSGAGATATSYYSKNDPDIMLKLFTSGIMGAEYASAFAAECKMLHSLKCGEKDFPSRKADVHDLHIFLQR